MKIGRTETLEKRTREHQADANPMGGSYEFLVAVPASSGEPEAIIHQYFRASRASVTGKRELFNDDEPLLDYIRWLRREAWTLYPLETLANDFKRVAVPNENWMPNAQRRCRVPIDDDGNATLFSVDRWWMPEATSCSIDDLYSPPKVVEAARCVMGDITLDPASSVYANSVVVRAGDFYDSSTNGLRRDWHGNVWLNPPFSTYNKWSKKLVGEWRSGRIRQMCVLCGSRILTAQHFYDALRLCSRLWIPYGRDQFVGGWARDKRNGAPSGYPVLYFGSDGERFRQVFLKLGGTIWSQQIHKET